MGASSSITWIDRHDAAMCHERLIERHGGSPGFRNESLQGWALSQPRNRAQVGERDIVYLAAVYTFGIARNYPYVDGNKRMAFLSGILFLDLNGYRFHGDAAEAARAVVALASGESDLEDYVAFLRENSAAL